MDDIRTGKIAPTELQNFRFESAFKCYENTAFRGVHGIKPVYCVRLFHSQHNILCVCLFKAAPILASIAGFALL